MLTILAVILFPYFCPKGAFVPEGSVFIEEIVSVPSFDNRKRPSETPLRRKSKRQQNQERDDADGVCTEIKKVVRFMFYYFLHDSYLVEAQLYYAFCYLFRIGRN